jgi:hypothetical protein
MRQMAAGEFDGEAAFESRSRRPAAPHRHRLNHARPPVLMLIKGLDNRIIHATTGKLLRELQLNPAVDYQALGVRKPRPKPN